MRRQIGHFRYWCDGVLETRLTGAAFPTVGFRFPHDLQRVALWAGDSLKPLLAGITLPLGGFRFPDRIAGGAMWAFHKE